MINFTPLRDLILVRPDPLPEQLGSIHVPAGVLRAGHESVKASDGGSRKTFTGVVLAIGPGDKRKSGGRHEMPVKVGDRVLYPGNPSAPGGLGDIVIDGEQLMIFHAEQSAYAVVEA